MGLANSILQNSLPTLWSTGQFMNSLGIDQSRVFGSWYNYIAGGLAICCVFLLFQLLRRLGFREVLESLPLQIWVLTMGIVLLFPNRVTLPGYKNSLMYIADRMSLAVGVCLCAVLASAPGRRLAAWGIGAASLLFFGFLYADERVLNQWEDRVEALVRQLPPYQRVIAGMADPYVRAEPLIHMIDRVCVGRCYSYANYEPSTDQFRIRVTAPNEIVIADYLDSATMQIGGYVVKQRDVPLYQVGIDEAGSLTIRSLPPGAPVRVSYIDAF